MSKVKHTQGPWTAETYRVCQETGWSVKAGDDTICDVWSGEIDTRFIVTACNSHYELLEALKAMVKMVCRTPMQELPEVKQACDAIAKAEGCA